MVSSTAPVTTATVEALKYLGTSSSISADTDGVTSDGLSTAVLPAARAGTSGANSNCTG